MSIYSLCSLFIFWSEVKFKICSWRRGRKEGKEGEERAKWRVEGEVDSASILQSSISSASSAFAYSRRTTLFSKSCLDSEQFGAGTGTSASFIGSLLFCSMTVTCWC